MKISDKDKNSTLAKLYNSYLFYIASLFIMHLPVFLAYYPGVYTFDVGIQLEQYELSPFRQNHPLIHTLFIGFFNNLFDEPNTGYAIATIIQMLVVELAMTYTLVFLYRKTQSIILCTFSALFYGLFPVNSLLTISATKDIFFSACVLIFFIDCIYFFEGNFSKKSDYVRFICNTVFMILLRNNMIYAFIPALIIIAFLQIRKKSAWKRFALCCVAAIILSSSINKSLVFVLDAHAGSIKEMLSIPCQELGRIYNTTDDEDTKNEILKYIPEPQNYNYYLSDQIKMQLDFDTFDSACKHFLLFTAICNLKYPIICTDAVFYNTQGFWDLFHCPYSEDHSFVSSTGYRGEAEIDSKFQTLCNFYDTYLHTTEPIADSPFIIFYNPALYIWIMLFFWIRSISTQNRALNYSCLVPLLYLCTILLSPGAIMRYVFPFVLMTPAFLAYMYQPKDVDSQNEIII